MTRSRPKPTPVVGCKRRNLTAIIVASLGVSALYLNFNPTPVGADPEELHSGIDRLSQMMSASADLEMAEVASRRSGEGGNFNPDLIVGKRAVLMQLLLLEKGHAKLSSISDYTATVYTQERVGGVLMDPQVMNLKIRHKPHSIYMKWLVGDKGRELLYNDGENDGNMVVKVGGIKGKLLPPLNLDPHGSIALQESRHPATRVGMLELARQLLVDSRRGLTLREGFNADMLTDQRFDERDCYCFRVVYEDPSVSEMYRKSIVMIDQEWCIPVMIKNFSWPMEGIEIDEANLDKETLVEHYSYTGIQFDQRLADADFSRRNKSYSFTR